MLLSGNLPFAAVYSWSFVLSVVSRREVYNPVVDVPRISDTDDAVTERQFEVWRRMTDGEKLQMNEAVRQLAIAGIKQRYPDASPLEQFLRLAQTTLGDELARKAYPELATLDNK